MGDILNSIFDWLGSSVLSALETFIVWVYNLAIAFFQVLWQVIGFVAQTVLNVIKAVGGFLKRLWDGFFKGIFSHVYNALKSLSDWLEKKLQPIIQFLQKMRKWLQIYYNTYIRPVLLMIQHIRQFLQILSALHIGFAQKLDQWLAQVQAKIVQAFATVVATVNTLTDVVNALMDPLYLLRKPALLLSIRRQIPALIRVFTGRPPGYFFGAPGVSSSSPFSLPKFPFNFSSASQNPLASSYLGTDDGIGDTSGFFDGFTFADGAVDQTSPLPYFDDDLYPPSPCTDPVKCLVQTVTVTVKPSS